MSLAKKIVILLVSMMVAAILIVPTVIGALMTPFMGGNSCVAAGQTSVGIDSLEGQSAEEYLESLRDAGVTEDGIQRKLQLVATIYSAGMSREVPATIKEIRIVVATGIQETNLTNLGDIEGEWDSAGFLQQRPSQGWGTLREVMDPTYATNVFLDRLHKRFNPADIDLIPMKDLAIVVQNPSRVAYERWNWDRTAAELIVMVAAPGAEGSCASASGDVVVPVLGDNLEVTSGFGNRDIGMHRGMDIIGGNGTIVAALEGRVLWAKRNGDWGYAVKIDHGDGVQTLYGHMVAGSLLVREGDLVKAGQPLGIMGNTGFSKGVHLHFELYNNDTRVNPEPFLIQHGIVIPHRD